MQGRNEKLIISSDILHENHLRCPHALPKQRLTTSVARSSIG